MSAKAPVLGELWKKVAGQDRAVSRLLSAIEGGTVAHAYLFLGPRGVGKRTVAKVFASAVNCADGGCGRCETCLKIDHESHPDVRMIEPAGNFIVIDQVRDEISRPAHLSPVEGAFKVFIVSEADAMTHQAANAFLKLLEEPPSRVVIILLATNLEAMLPTVISRCQPIHFQPIPIPLIKELLVTRYGLAAQQADLLARISSGVFGNALRLAHSHGGLTRRAAALDVMEQLPQSDDLILMQCATRLMEEIGKPVAELKKEQKEELGEASERAVSNSHLSYMKRVFTERHKRELGREERRGMEEVLVVMQSWLRDLMIVKVGADAVLVANFDREVELMRQAPLYDTGRLLASIEAVGKTREMIRYNVGAQLALEVLLFELQDLVHAERLIS